MILGFAHLTLGAAQVDKAVGRLLERGFSLKSSHRGIPSAAAKWPLMARRAKSHDLVLMSGGVAVEIVSHDTGSVTTGAVLDFSAESGQVILRVEHVARERDFLLASLSCVANEGIIEVRGAFPSWNVRLELVADSAVPALPPLDIEGFSCLAFYSNNIREDIARLLALGARDATDEFEINLNGRALSIAMLRSPGGAILELIKAKRQ